MPTSTFRQVTYANDSSTTLSFVADRSGLIFQKTHTEPGEAAAFSFVNNQVQMSLVNVDARVLDLAFG